LSDLRGRFVDTVAYEQALSKDDSVVYTICALEQPPGEGQLNLAVGLILPGKIGMEYFMTKGHFHAWRPAAEFYIGLSGEGCLLLESEGGSQAKWSLRPNSAVYVPGNTAHRTMNTATVLWFPCIYPTQSGHDYATIAQQNFHHVVIERNGNPVMLRREQL
jgi:glucose-6-phosphate isomerase